MAVLLTKPNTTARVNASLLWAIKLVHGGPKIISSERANHMTSPLSSALAAT